MTTSNQPSPNDRSTLLSWLQTALEIELATIPPYLVALLSIKLPANREPAELIRSVMVEEMLHLTLVANVINAVDGRPRLDKSAIPTYPLQMNFQGQAFCDRRFPIDLAPFGSDSIGTFLKIEEPQRLEPRIGAMLVEEMNVPGLTIGEFYSNIVALLDDLEKKAPGQLFVGDPKRQVSQDYYWSGGGQIVAVRDLASAKVALDLVISQGEGAWPKPDDSASTGFGKPLEMGHFFRFNEIACARRYKRSDDPTGPPSGEPIEVDYSAVYPIKVNPKRDDYAPGTKLFELNELFNRKYTTMLSQLQEALSGAPKTLYTAIMDSMHGLTPIAHEIMKIPVDGTVGSPTGCPTFDWVAPLY